MDSTSTDWDSPVLRRHAPVTYWAYPDLLLLEWDDAYEEERKPHPGVRTNNAHCSRVKLTSGELSSPSGRERSYHYDTWGRFGRWRQRLCACP